jgi:D-alanyl-D-alanine carboxypeptidase/D-alanyl-D-alanine-endopeptidase (penicillin-binding protein 4)
MKKGLLLFLFIFWGSEGNAQSIRQRHKRCRQTLLPKIKKIIKHNKARHAFWALAVRDTTGKMLQCFHTQKLMRPASNLKLLTAATALHELGPDFRFETPVYGRGELEDSVWAGDIIIRGKGDPSISGLFYDEDRLYVMEEFYQALKMKGIQKIKGNIIANDSYFDRKPYPEGWEWDDFSHYYAPEVNALSFNNNAVDITIYGNGNVGDEPAIEWFPFNTDYVNFVNDQQITPKKAYYVGHFRRLLGTNTIELKSSIPKGLVVRKSLPISDPPLYFINTLKQYLEKEGIKVTGHLVVNSRSRNWHSPLYKKLAVHLSPPLRKITKHMMKKSDNFYAEMLLKTIAAEHFHTQGTTELGISLEKQYASSLGIHLSNINLSDGSGMSAYDLITTGALSKLLVIMRNKFAYTNSLSVGGVDGTLEYRFNRTPLAGRVIAKTGYVSGVRSISGYLKTKTDNTLIFSLITNNYEIPTRYVNSTEGSILKVLYNHY